MDDPEVILGYWPSGHLKTQISVEGDVEIRRYPSWQVPHCVEEAPSTRQLFTVPGVAGSGPLRSCMGIDSK